MKQVFLAQYDIRMLNLVHKLLLEAKFDVKGEAVSMVHSGIQYIESFRSMIEKIPEHVEPAQIAAPVKKGAK